MNVLQMTSANWGLVVVLVVAGFALGNFMAARPHAKDVRTADLRLLARQLQLYPKLVDCPDWLIDRLDQPADTQNIYATKSTPRLTHYTLVVDDLALPAARYVAIDGAWQPIETGLSSQSQLAKRASALAGLPLDLPPSLSPLVVGLQAKANSISIYWQDHRYQHQAGAHKLDTKQANEDLRLLKSALMAWAEKI